jgi:glycosyltransferase involved in cell wall biosynthesis
MERRDIFVVIPTFNDNSVLRATVSDVIEHGYSVIVVDDGSSTPAREILEGLEVHCLRHVVNLGQGAALQTGSEFALSKGALVIVHFDADGQHDPALIECLIAPVLRGEADVALGSRFLDPADRAEVPFAKRLLLKGGIFVSWMFTGVWLSDTHNGFRALSRNAAAMIRMEENGFAHATEILDLLRRSRLSWVEVPVAIHYTAYSRRKGQHASNSVNILIDLVLRRLFH